MGYRGLAVPASPRLVAGATVRLLIVDVTVRLRGVTVTAAADDPPCG